MLPGGKTVKNSCCAEESFRPVDFFRILVDNFNPPGSAGTGFDLNFA